MKIVLIGATGQVGSALARTLADQEHALTVLVRKAAGLGFPAGVRVVQEAEFSQASFAGVLEGMDCAIYGIGLPEQFAFDTGIFERVNYGLFKTFLAALEQSSLRRLVYISTYEVFAPQQGRMVETNPVSPLEGLSPYFRAMTMAYSEAIAFAQRTGTQLTTIHPAALYGGLNTGEGVTNVIENLLNWRLWKLPVILPGRFPVIHAQSLANGIATSLSHTGAYLLSDTMTSFKELSQALRKQVHSYLPPEVPAALAYGAVAPVEALGRALHFRPMLCKAQLDFITAGNEPVADHAIKVMGWQPWTLDQGLRTYLAERKGLLAALQS